MLGGRSAPPSPPKIPRVNLGSQKPCEVRSSEYRRSFTTLRSISPPRRVSGIKYWHSTHRTNLQHRLVLELSEGLPFDRRQAQWRIDLFWRQLQALSARSCRSLARNLHSSGYTQSTCSQGGGTREGFEKRWRTTTTSVRGV